MRLRHEMSAASGGLRLPSFPSGSGDTCLPGSVKCVSPLLCWSHEAEEKLQVKRRAYLFNDYVLCTCYILGIVPNSEDTAGVARYTCDPNTGVAEARGPKVQASLCYIQSLYPETAAAKRN